MKTLKLDNPKKIIINLIRIDQIEVLLDFKNIVNLYISDKKILDCCET